MPDHSEVTIVTDPVRIMTIGMTQIRGQGIPGIQGAETEEDRR